MPNQQEIKAAIEQLIKAMKWDKDPNFKETGIRVAVWFEVYNGHSPQDIKKHVARHLSKKFPTKYTGIVNVGPSKVYSLCPHHLLPIEYDVYIGMIPKKHALGLSKYTRIAIEVARYPYIQEDYTKALADYIQEGLDCKGVIVVVEGIHNCMRCRGVKDLNASTKTSYITGVFAKPPRGFDPVSEFFRLINHGR